ncbi:MAG: redoxin domain-containing protein [Planctomycetota bacterium]|nr:redoxin domain-containing protein [Planctomycetota bacterium]
MRTCFSLLCLLPLMVACDAQTIPPQVSESAAETTATADVKTNAEEASTTVSNPIAAREQLEERVAQLDREFDLLKQNVAEATTQEQQVQLLREGNPVPQFVADMIELSQQFPQDQIAVDAMLAAVARSSGQSKVTAMNHLLDHFADRLQLKKMADQFLKDIPSPETEAYLLKMIEQAPTPETKAHLLLGYSNYVDQIFPFRKALAANPNLAARLPEAQMEYINTPRSESQKIQRETFLQQIIDRHGDVVYRGQKTYGEVAAAELYELQNLSVGDVAPEMVGQDMDGTEFCLSDYRGKIVMLDFWGHWCPPCRAMYGHEQQLVEKLGSAPFALLGVNSDRDIETAIGAINDENLSWRNFWIGPEGTSGPLAKQWNIAAWPTVYLIGPDGVIRHKDILGDDLNAALEEMLAEMGHQVDLKGIK